MNLDPAFLFDMIAKTVPQDLHPNILIVGSIAAAYHHRDALTGQAVQTKDADVVVQPAGAIEECRQIAKRLLAEGWRPIDDCKPSRKPEPADELLAIRLNPGETTSFFIELLGLPQPGQAESIRWVPCELDDGWYGIPCFRFMTLLVDDRRNTELGIQYASPPLMALANLLSHPRVGTAVMRKPIGGKTILRSAKDLGRVLALARLHEGDLEEWLPIWEAALLRHFATDQRNLAAHAGDGLRELLEDDNALEQAHHTTNVSLLRGLDMTPERLRIIGEQVLQFIIDPLAEKLSRVT